MRRFGILAASLLLLVGLALVRLPTAAIAQSPAPFLYAFLTRDAANPEQLTVNTFDPATPDQMMASFSFTANRYASGAYPSPDGRWLALAYSPGTGFAPDNDAIFWVVDVVTGQARRIAPIDLISDDSTLLETFPAIYWSPDSQYLAFTKHAGQGDNIGLYSVKTQLLTTLNTDRAIRYQLTWSNDSSTLVAQARRCDSSQCRLSFEIYDIGTKKLLFAMPFQPSSKIIPENYNVVACYLSWSPNDQSIGFMYPCDGTTASSYNEIYTFRASGGQVTRLTDMQATLGENFSDPGIESVHKLLWIDGQTLLVSTTASKAQRTAIIQQTIAYNVLNRRATPVSDNAFSALAFDKTSGRIALRMGSVSGDTAITEPTVQIATYSNNTLTIQRTISCDGALSWSPDGIYLVCSTFDKATFIRWQDQRITTHTFNAGDVPFGWITALAAINRIPFPLVEPTSTPLPTSTPKQTATLVPSATPVPTSTPQPSSTPLIELRVEES
jgi:hypothetical protein